MNTSENGFKIIICGIHGDLIRTRELLNFLLIQHGLDELDAARIEMAVYEACDNALHHGSKQSELACFNLELNLTNEFIKAVIIDTGEVIDFDKIEPFNINQNFMAYKDGGLGIPLIKALIDDVRYIRKNNNTNKLTLIQYIKNKENQEGDR